ncbi:MAG: molybdopterin-dependent oxidoreductase [Treponemataceae bacterium]|nr:MAG: molybdopterin-dependent oxidoreductase [Treponemataceae bacterium]
MQNSEFYSDVTVPGMLYAKLIRAPKDGILKNITPAPNLPADIYFYTAKDIPGVNLARTLETAAPVFAASKVSFKGEPVGIAAGENEKEVERAAAQIIIEIEPDPDSAGPPRKILNRAFRNIPSGKEPETSGEELINIESSYAISHTSGILAEPAGCFASFADGKLTVCCPTEWARHLRENLSAALDIPASKIEIIKSRAVSHSSVSVWYSAVLACQAGLAAMLSGHAVKLVLSREEHARFLENPMNCVITHKSLAAHNGEIISMDIEILADAGSENPFAREILDRLAVSAAGMYRPKRLSVNASIVSSREPPANVFLSRIEYHSFFAAENHIQSIARRMSDFPLDARKINSTGTAARKNKSPFVFDLNNSDAVLDTVASASDFSRKYSAYAMQSNKRKAGNRQPFSAPVRGIGIAWAFAPGAFYGTAFSEPGYAGYAEQELEVTLEQDGAVTINTYQPPRSIKSIWTETAAALLDVPAARVSFTSDFQREREPFLPSQAYADIGAMTELLRQCCGEAQKLRLAEPLPITVKRAAPQTRGERWDSGQFCGQPYHTTAPRSRRSGNRA